MDVEKLITLVEERRSLWDQKCKQYHNRELNKNLWKEVAEKLTLTDDVVRQKWRGLRDTFRKELAKLQEKRSGTGAEELSSKWQFFDYMLFVKDQFVPRKVTGNIPNDKIQENATYDETEENEPLEVADISDNEQLRTDKKRILEIENESTFITHPTSSKRPLFETDSQPTSIPSKKIKKAKDNTIQRLLAIEEKKFNHLQKGSQQYQQQQDDDHYFALSLVPYIRQLPNHRKLFIRTKFQELLTHEHEALFQWQHIAPQAEPEYLQGRNQNISQDSNVASSRMTTTEKNVPHSDFTATVSSKAKIEHRTFVPGQRDASDSFGEHVAAKHRQYMDYVKSYVEHEIAQVLFEADMGKYDPLPGDRPSQGTADATNSRAAFSTNSAGAAKGTKTTTAVRRSSTSAGMVEAQTTNSSTSAVHHTAVGAADHFRTTTAQHSNAATTAVDQSHLLDPNIVIKSSPAHTPSYSSEIDDNDEESETVLSNTGASPFVVNERMSEDEE